ncbi:hypothetical protein ACFY05_21785 [Microtetraspora fusca]|uniref:DNA topoisomerase n=1 Tax=Microtetraspora fusca TaxID=1997 RepID=A0ABW6V844_MICFU
MVRGVDLRRPARPHPGRRHRRRRAAAVPLPRRLAGAAGPGQVRPRPGGRRAAPRLPPAGGRGPARRRADPRAGAGRGGADAGHRVLPGRGEEYTDSYGLATLRTSHVRCAEGRVVCAYTAKGGKRREQVLADAEVCEVVQALLGRKGELLRYRSEGGWVDVRSDDINAYLKEAFGRDVSAKDFRTWHATVLAAVGLSVSRRVRGTRGRRRAISRVMAEVAEYLGNTPSVARSSYVDPRLIEMYERGRFIPLESLGADVEEGGLATHGAAEQAVITLLRRAASEPGH